MRAKAVLLALVGLLVVAGCSGSPSHATPSGPSAPSSPGATTTAGTPNGGPAPGSSGTPADRAAAFRKWGVPLLPPPPAPPAVKPVKTGGSLLPVVSRVPTQAKIVFVTFDDGAEKDPKFVQMMQDLRIPFTMFLTDQIIRSDYGYFRPLKALGNSIEDHTLSHPYLPKLSEARQHDEICGQQTRLAREYGTRPGLFRPPYGSYTKVTKNVVASCGGLRAIILWRESMQIHDVTYQDPGKRYHPGDIILAHFRGPKELKGESMTAMVAHLLRSIAAQGYTVANLEDYV